MKPNTGYYESRIIGALVISFKMHLYERLTVLILGFCGPCTLSISLEKQSRVVQACWVGVQYDYAEISITDRFPTEILCQIPSHNKKDRFLVEELE